MLLDKYIAYLLYSGALIFFLFLVFITPVLAFEKNNASDVLYNGVFPAFCHQKISRSLCLFKNIDGGYFIADCTAQIGKYVSNDGKQLSAVSDGNLGYKFPICARDIGIFVGMLLGGFGYLFVRKVDSEDMPDKYVLIVGLIPIGIDGTVQLISNAGIPIPILGSYESTNLVRLVTGGIIGVIIPFYLLPILALMAKNILKTFRKA